VSRWFAPRVLALHLLALVLCGVMAAAGVWQWRSYESNQRQSSASVLAELASEPPVKLASVMGADDAFPDDAVGRRVVVSGRYSRPQFFVTDRIQAGRSGDWVLTPLVTTAGAAILVVRGWVDDLTDPVTAVPAGRVTVTGSLEPPESADSAGADAVDRGREVSIVATSVLVGKVPFDLYSAYLIAEDQTPPQREGLVPVTVPRPAASSWAGLRNALYSVQWFVFAAFVLYMWWRICREQTQVA
jgi:cytochrome oxidase assembly protein ShyY1